MAMKVAAIVGLGLSVHTQLTAGQDGSTRSELSFSDFNTALDSSVEVPNTLASVVDTTVKADTTGLKVKLFNKVDLAGKKLVVKTESDVCYDVAPCFDNLATSLSWSKVPGLTTSIELFESAGCTDHSVVISELGPVGASGNVTALKAYKFNNKMSSFIVHSAPDVRSIQSRVDACPATDVSGSGSSGGSSGSVDVGDDDKAAPAPGGLKLKLFNKVDLAGKKLVVKTESDVCYNVAPCFDDMATSLEWSKTPSGLKAIELFESAGCSGSNVSISDLGPVGGGGNITALKAYKFNNKLSSFVVRSVGGANEVSSAVDACVEGDNNGNGSAADDATPAPTSPQALPSTPAPTLDLDPAPTPTPESTSPPAPTPVAENVPSPTPTPFQPSPAGTPSPSKASGLKVKLYNKPDLTGKKLVITAANDACYSVDACFEDMTTSVEWTKIPSAGLSLEFFESPGCTNASITLTDLGGIGGSGNVSMLKMYKFNNRVSSFVVRSAPGTAPPASNVDACVDNSVSRNL